MARKCIISVQVDIKVQEGTTTTMAEKLEKGSCSQHEEAMRAAVLASLVGSDFQRWVEARERLSPLEKEQQLEELRALLVRCEGPGGP